MIASEHGHLQVVEILLRNRANVDLQNSDGNTALMIASEHGHLQVVEILLRNRANVDLQDSYGSTALMYASEHGHLQVVEILLRNLANVDLQNSDGILALMYASEYGHHQVVEILLDNRASVHLRQFPLRFQNDGPDALYIASTTVTSNVAVVRHLVRHHADVNGAGDFRPLIGACSRGWLCLEHDYSRHAGARNDYPSTVEFLLNNGAQVNATDNSGYSELMVACSGGYALDIDKPGVDIEIVRRLIEAGAPVNAQSNVGETALIEASRCGYFEVVDILLEHNAQVDLRTNAGVTALIEASRCGHDKVVDTLLKHDAQGQVDLRTNAGFTALMMASNSGHVEVVDKLLRYGAQVDVQTGDGYTALMRASQYGHHQVVRKLLDNRANPYMRGRNHGPDALYMASTAVTSNVDVVTHLVQHNANVNGADNFRPLIGACSRGWLGPRDDYSRYAGARNDFHSTVEFLLNNGVQVNATDSSGCTALMIACSAGTDIDPRIIGSLIGAGANVNAKDNNGCTVLMKAAACENNVDAVRVLIENGAEVNAKDNNGCTVLMKAAACENNVDAVRVLIENGAEVNAKDNNECTVLMKAVELQRVNAAKILMDAGAYVSERDNGETRELALGFDGNTDMRKLLKLHFFADNQPLVTPASAAVTQDLDILMRRLDARDAEYDKLERIGSVLSGVGVSQNNFSDSLLLHLLNISVPEHFIEGDRATFLGEAKTNAYSCFAQI